MELIGSGRWTVQEGTGWFMAHFLNAFFDLFTTQFLLDQYTEDVLLIHFFFQSLQDLVTTMVNV